jgi:hypothetical protein
MIEALRGLKLTAQQQGRQRICSVSIAILREEERRREKKREEERRREKKREEERRTHAWRPYGFSKFPAAPLIAPWLSDFKSSQKKERQKSFRSPRFLFEKATSATWWM